MKTIIDRSIIKKVYVFNFVYKKKDLGFLNKKNLKKKDIII